MSRISSLSHIYRQSSTLLSPSTFALSDTTLPSDYNTRFSGIRPEHLERATHDLAGIRERLHALMDADSILVGHALENDLKTLRIIHHRCVDTALLFPHGSGAPYRKALRDL